MGAMNRHTNNTRDPARNARPRRTGIPACPRHAATTLEPSIDEVCIAANPGDSGLQITTGAPTAMLRTGKDALSCGRTIQMALSAALFLLCATAGFAAPLRNADFAISDPMDAGFGWTSVGSLTVQNGAGILAEDGVQLPVSLSQTFDLPADAVLLHITLNAINLQDNAALEPPDAFQISLLNASSQSLVGVTPQSETTALFSYQRDGTVHYGANTQVPGAGASGTTWTPAFPVTVSIDLSDLTTDVAATLAFDLIGLGTAASSIAIESVALEGLEPTANDDTDMTDEETAVAVAVLANDVPATGKTLDPASIQIASGPSHGMTSIDTQSGKIEYTPAIDYSGPDSLTYTVADTDGNRSEPATLSLTVNAVNDAPTLQAPANLTATKQTAKAVTGVVLGDVDAGSGNLTLTLSVTRGTLTLADDVSGGATAGQITGNNTASVSIIAPLASINATLADAKGLNYTGLLNLIGADTLQLSLNDNNNTGSGGAKSASASVAIDVTGSVQEAWRNQHFSLAILTDPTKEATHWGDVADPDNDQQDNSYEFVADTDPNSAASKFQFRFAKGSPGIDLIFSPISGARTYSVQFTDQIGQTYAPVTNGTAADDGDTRTVTIPTDVAKRFFRVQISVGD